MKYYKGQKYSKSFNIDSKTVKLFAKVSKDDNPIHLDEDYAKNTIFKTRIAHGMLIGGYISSILGNDFPGNGTIYVNQNMAFKRPIHINDTVNIIIELTDIKDNGWLLLSTNCFVNDYIVIEGSALVIPPKSF